MKNLKRLFCLALSLVMLSGMLVIGAGASDFADAEQIVNTEAVEITAGLGLFAGTDGKFLPKNTVTRAQMATIIVKMLRGSDFNADAFKGVDKFPDTASFEGGWAEGYINACVQMGVVAGYPDGTYQPGKELTTAEAVTMIINALKVNPGSGEWPLNYMAKAEQMKLFDEVKTKPNTNEALNRDTLAGVVLQGLRYSPSNANAYKVTGLSVTFSTFNEALAVALNKDLTANDVVEIPGTDTLAKKTFELQTANGIVADNEATGAKYTKLSGDSTDYNVKTGLDMIGHRVTIYFKNVEKDSEKTVYCVIDDCETVNVAKAINNANDYKAAFGKNKELAPAAELTVLDSDYTKLTATTVAGYVVGSKAPAGIYVVYEDQIITYIKAPKVFSSQVSDISTSADTGYIMLAGMTTTLKNVEGNDQVVEYDGIAVKDYVTYTVARDRYVLKRADPVTGIITKTSTDKDGKDVITIGGVDYVFFGGTNNAGLTTGTAAIDFEQKYTLYVTEDDEYIGFKSADALSGGTGDISDVAYIFGVYNVDETDEFGSKTRNYYAQGIDITEGTEARLLIGTEYDTNADGTFGGAGDNASLGVKTITFASGSTEGWFRFKDHTGKDEKKAGIQVLTMINKTYNKDTNPLFWGYWSIGEGNTLQSSDSGWWIHVCGTGCTLTHPTNLLTHTQSGGSTQMVYMNRNDSYTFFDGQLGRELKITRIPMSSMNYKTVGNTFVVLLGKDDNGTVVAKALIERRDPENISTGTSSEGRIYIAEHQLTPAGANSVGQIYEVYDARTGAIKELAFQAGNGPKAGDNGFWDYSIDSDGYAKLGTKKLDPANDYNVCQDYLLTGVDAEKANRLSALKLGSSSYYTGHFTPNNKNPSSAKVIDVRTEEEIEASGIDKVTSVQQMMTLNNAGRFVVFDCISTATSSTSLAAIYVTGVYSLPAAPETVKLSAAPAVNSVNTVMLPDGTYKKIFISTKSSLTGWVEYKNSSGKGVVSASNSTVSGLIKKTDLTGTVLTVGGKSFDVSAVSFDDQTGNGITSVSVLAAKLNIIGLQINCTVLCDSTKTVPLEVAITKVNDSGVGIDTGNFSGGVLTYASAAYDFATATIADHTGNGIDSIAKIDTALATAGVSSLGCTIEMDPTGTVVQTVTIKSAVVASPFPAPVSHTLANADFIYSPGPLPSSNGEGYGDGSGEVWLIFNQKAGKYDVKPVNITFEVARGATKKVGQFYRYISASPSRLHGGLLSAFGVAESYQFAHLNVIDSITFGGSSYTMVTHDLPGVTTVGAYTNETGTSGSLKVVSDYEALATTTVSASVPVIDCRPGAIPGMGFISNLDELIAHVNNGEQILVDYYCRNQMSTEQPKPTAQTCNCIFICADQNP